MENKICIYAICKNELKFVDKWLDSVQEADYIVVLDTGSTDGTYEKLKADPRVTRVEQKIINPWRFDEARNESLKLVPEDTTIYVCIDLDEVFEPGWAKILKDNWIPGKHKRAAYKFVWSHLANGEPGLIYEFHKIHSKEWKWIYPVHELLWNTETQTSDYYASDSLELFDQLVLHHYPDNTKSRGSYKGLLELREQEYPDDYYGVLYLAHEYKYQGQYKDSIKKLHKVIDKFSDKLTTLEKANCYLFLGDDYNELGQQDKAVMSYLQSIAIEPTYREPYLGLARIYLDRQQYTLAIDILRQGLEKSERHYSWLERTTSWSYEPFDLLCLAYYYGGDKLKSLGCAYKAFLFEPGNDRLRENVLQVINTMADTDY